MNNRNFISLLCVYSCILIVQSLAAQSYQLEFNKNPLGIKFQTNTDSFRAVQTIMRIRNEYVLNAYLECNVDSIIWSKPKVKAYMHIGPKYLVNDIRITSDSSSITFQNYRIKYLNTVFDTFKLKRISNDILTSMENTGYPFTYIQTEIEYSEKGVDCNLHIQPGEFFAFDTCHIEGDANIKKSFLQAYTGIKKGTPYNEALFRKANDKLQQLPFLSSVRNPLLVFIHGGKAKPYYYLSKKRSDQINILVGLAPGISAPGASSNNVTFTGEFALKLNNLFRSAKVLSINWRSFRARSQELKTYFSYPYILSRPIGADIGIDLVKFDTLYTIFQRQVGVQYFTSGISGFKVFYKVSTTNLNSVDTLAIRLNRQFPAINSIEVKQYGVMANFNLLDYRFNPRRGIFIDAGASVGSKDILRDNQISEIRFGQEQVNLYDSATIRTTQYQYKIRVDKYFPIAAKSTIKLGLYATQIIAPQIYFNELEREGGINSLKGFNEQSIFASNFNMIELEYRFLVGLNSHFKIFWNGAYYEDKSYGRQNQIFDIPWGFGIGGNIETRAGILSLIYALGKEKSNNFDIRTGKFHFGLSGYF